MQRGMHGYCAHAKKAELIKTILMFALVFAILITGILTTGTRMNLLTIVAVVGCLPAARYCVNFIARAPYRSLSDSLVDAVENSAGDVPVYYELMLGARDKIRFVDCIAISGHGICGLALHPKSDPSETAAYLRKIASESGYKKITAKIYDNKEDFLNRLEEMASHYDSDEDMRDYEQALGHTITLYCL